MTVSQPIRFGRHPHDRPLPRREWLEATETVRAALAELDARTDPGRSGELPDPAGLVV
jgi:hypothetical protein